MRGQVSVIIALTVMLAAVISGHSSDKASRNIVDVSWPNCTIAQPATYASGIVGVTGGLDFHANPCLAKESTWFLRYAVYINTGYPGNVRGRKFISSPRRCGYNDSRCLAYNYGFHAAQYAIRYANLQNVHADLWWLDVETVNSWTNNFLINRQFLNGAMAAIRQQIWFATVGIYSAPAQWQDIVGPWHNKLPAWLATGATNRTAAVRACRNKSFTGGAIWLAQYTSGLDRNITCTRQFENHLLQYQRP